MRSFLLNTPGAILLVSGAALDPAAATAQVPVETRSNVVLPPDRDAAEINPAGREVTLTASVMDGSVYLGDATASLGIDGMVTFSAERLLTLLEPRLRSEILENLRTALARNLTLRQADLQSNGVGVRYDPQTLQIELAIAPASRAANVVGLSDESGRVVSYAAPADVSAYLNVRGAMDWVQQGDDQGLNAPVMFLDGAARIKGLVLETEANWQPGAAGVDFQRRGTRLVYDDRDQLVRWSAGDLMTIARGFQAASEIAGVGVTRRYSVLEPQTIIRPRGSRSFQLERRSLVEVRINGQLVRRIELDPGAYDLQDFPFTQGANDVELTITDDAGRTERLEFNIFLDQAQLAEGLSEFGFYAGVLAPLGFSGPRYGDTPAFSGFYRRGISDRVTLGANFQADTQGWMGGGEAVVATPIGSLAAFGSASQVDGHGKGWATLLTFQRSIARGGLGSDSLSLSLETRSREFAPVGVVAPFNPYSLIAGAGYSASLTENIYAGVDARYSRGRDDEPDVTSIRGSLGGNLTPTLSFAGDLTYERDRRGSRFAGFLSVTYRFSQRSSVRADIDSRYDRVRLAYQTFGGAGVGAYSVSADIEQSDIGAGASVNANYYANRAELGFSHFGLFERDLGGSTGQRSSFRFGTALAYADGAVSVGRPVHDAFAIVKAHRSLADHEVLVDPIDDSANASTGLLGTALQPSLSSYSDRSLTITAPEAPIDVDLGAGSFRLLPPYRGGYLLTVGSDYNVTAVGRLLQANGEPLVLLSGTATEAANPEREPVPFFTNGAGRFGVTGLAPGRWVLQISGDPAQYVIDLPDEGGTVSLGDVLPQASS